MFNIKSSILLSTALLLYVYYREPRWLDRLLDSVLGYDEWPLQKIKEVGHESVEVKRNRNMLKSDACTGHCVFIPTQRHLTCNLDDFCVPSIATTKKEIMFIFTTANMISCWKVEEWTCSLKFWEQKPTLNYDAILAVWLVVSYRLLCNGPQSLLQVPKASFMQGQSLTNNIRSHTSFDNYGYSDILK